MVAFFAADVALTEAKPRSQQAGSPARRADGSMAYTREEGWILVDLNEGGCAMTPILRDPRELVRPPHR